jgi:hypothetical protein
MLETTQTIDIEQVVATLRKDYTKLSARVRELMHSVKCEQDGITLRLHFPAIRQGKATVPELIDVLLDYMTIFALPRSKTKNLQDEYGKIGDEEYRLKCEQSQREAISLFKRAQEATNRNGEAGELLLYLLTEWILGAPQLLAKMSLKTNRNMPVHGADGLHIGYSSDKKGMLIYWGESKFYSNVDEAISKACESIQKALQVESVEHEINLAVRHIDLTGLTSEAKASVLNYLDPFQESYNKRIDVSTCLIGFDFDAYNRLTAKSEADDDQLFRSLAAARLSDLSPKLSKALKSAGIKKHLIEMFFFPLPSVQKFRDIFQSKIGWKK